MSQADESLPADARARERFMRKVRVEDGCWIWTAARNLSGYGILRHDGRTRLAHRVAYEMFVGPMGDLCVCHRCDVPTCVNPAHMFLGTRADNAADRDAKGRTASGERNGARTKPERVSRGERHPGAKLTDAQVNEMRVIYGEWSTTQTALAKRYGVSVATVSLIVRGLHRRQ